MRGAEVAELATSNWQLGSEASDVAYGELWGGARVAKGSK